MQFKALLALLPFVAAVAAIPVGEASTLAKRQGTNARITWYDVSVGM